MAWSDKSDEDTHGAVDTAAQALGLDAVLMKSVIRLYAERNWEIHNKLEEKLRDASINFAEIAHQFLRHLEELHSVFLEEQKEEREVVALV